MIVSCAYRILIYLLFLVVDLIFHFFTFFLLLLFQIYMIDEVETELITATEIKKLFLDMLTKEDIISIHCDVIAAAYRSPSVQLAMLAILFQTGLHTLVCYRVGHRLWQNDRTGLAKYLQSVISKHYSADIHPACTIGQGIYLCTAAGVGKAIITQICD
jgi:serine O-acetyltransferase